MNEVWILLSILNEYNQPPKAFEAIFWEEPNVLDLRKHFSVMTNDYLDHLFIEILKGVHTRVWGADYWIEKFTKP